MSDRAPDPAGRSSMRTKQVLDHYPRQGPLPEMGFEEDLVAIELRAEGRVDLPVDGDGD
jgi:hypothetical protein